MLDIFKGFLPWILFSIIYRSSEQYFMTAITLAIMSLLLLNWRHFKRKFVLMWCSLVYFMVVFGLTLTFHWQWLQINTWFISNIVLASIAFGSYLFNKPFTVQYAKMTTAEIYWENPLFIQINNILTNVWAAIFLFTAMIDYWHTNSPVLGTTSYQILSNIGWVVGIVISKRFPSYWKAKKIQKKQQRQTPESQNIFLQGNFAPWRSEDNVESLEVVGNIPNDLNGVLLRNGPNPQFDPIGHYHWFEGDGMIHAIRLSEGGRASYDNRWVRTQRFELEREAGKALFSADLSGDANQLIQGVDGNTANTNIIAYQDTLLALNEGASPTSMLLSNLATNGRYTFNEQIKTRVTAHPRYDHNTQEFLAYSYINEDGSLRYYKLDKQNKLIVEARINWPYASMMHDFVMTEHYVVFPVFPCTMSFERMMKGESIFMWEGDVHESHFIITDRQGNEVTRVTTDPCYVYHFGNAYEQGNSIIIDAMRSAQVALMPDRSGRVPARDDTAAVLVRWYIDLSNNQISMQTLAEDIGEFPRFDERFNGYPYRHLYVAAREQACEDHFSKIIHYDLEAHTQCIHDFANDAASEPVFVARSNQEGDGYLLTVVYRTNEDRSDVVILDAKQIDAEPLAIIRIPHRIPYGFHGNFVKTQPA